MGLPDFVVPSTHLAKDGLLAFTVCGAGDHMMEGWAEPPATDLRRQAMAAELKSYCRALWCLPPESPMMVVWGSHGEPQQSEPEPEPQSFAPTVFSRDEREAAVRCAAAGGMALLQLQLGGALFDLDKSRLYEAAHSFGQVVSIILDEGTHEQRIERAGAPFANAMRSGVRVSRGQQP